MRQKNVHLVDVYTALMIQHAPLPPSETNAHALDPSGSRTLRRGLQLLDIVMQSGHEGIRVVDLCRFAGLERATIHRLLATLMEADYVTRSGRFRYIAGARLAEIQKPSPSTTDIATRLQPVLARVSKASGDAAFAIVRDGSNSHCIARQVGTHPIQILVIEVGTRQPLGVGAAGLALLAALPDEEVDQVIEANAAVLWRYGGMSQQRLEILLRATRERGWAVIGNHATEGVLAVGASVLGRNGTPAAAISVASTMERMPRARQQLIAQWIQEALSDCLPKGL